MAGLAVSRIARKWQDLDWALLKGSALLSVGTAVARILGLAFSLVLAAAFSAGDFGAVRYAIAVASIVGIGAQPFGQHVVARFISKERNDPAQINSVLSNLFFLLPVIFVVTLVIAIPILYRLSIFSIGILAIFAGETLFYTYWGLSSGFLEPVRLTVAYLGSNLVQIVLTLGLISALGIRSPTLALLIYGLSYLLPLALLCVFWPLPGRIDFHLVRRTIIGRVLRFSVPIWISHACYVLSASLDLLLLAPAVSAGQLGAYTLSKTLATVFIFVPTGISTLLMPRVASTPDGTHGRALTRMLGISLLVNGLILAVYLPIVGPFTQKVFGVEYLVRPGISLLLASFMILSGIHSMVTAVFVGRGRPEAESVSRAIDLVMVAGSCSLLVPVYGALGAATAMLAGKVGALLTYGALQLYGVKAGDRRPITWRLASGVFTRNKSPK